MPSYKLRPYWARIYKEGDSSEQCNFTDVSSFDPTAGNTSITEIFESMLSDLSDDFEQFDSGNKTFSISQYERDGDDHTIEGIAAKGEYGYERQGIDIEDGSEEYRREQIHTEPDPFYFLYHVPPSDPTRALVILQLRGRRGIKGEIETIFRSQYLNGVFDRDFTFSLNPVYNQNITEIIRESDEVKQLRLAGRKTLSPAEELGSERGSTDRENLESEEVKIKFSLDAQKSNSILKPLTQAIAGEEGDWTYTEIIDEDFDSGAARIQQGDNEYSVPIWSETTYPEKRISPDEFREMNGQDPTPTSIAEIARNVANDWLARFEIDEEPIIDDTMIETDDDQE